MVNNTLLRKKAKNNFCWPKTSKKGQKKVKRPKKISLAKRLKKKAKFPVFGQKKANLATLM